MRRARFAPGKRNRRCTGSKPSRWTPLARWIAYLAGVCLVAIGIGPANAQASRSYSVVGDAIHATQVPDPCRRRDRARGDAAARRGDPRHAGVRDPQRYGVSRGQDRQGQARHSAFGRERQHRADDGKRRAPDGARGPRQKHSRLQRKEPAAEYRQFLFRSSGRPRPGLDAYSPGRQPEDRRDRKTLRRQLLVRERRRRRHARCLHRGGDLMAAALINVPAKAKRGEIIEIKTLMSHIMETGYRHTVSGEVVPRDIITGFICCFNGAEIFRADLFPALSANPFITCFTTVTESGKLEFEWIGDKGFSESASASMTVE